MTDQDYRGFTFGSRLKVSFNPNVQVLKMHVWSYAYHTARISRWRQDYLDRKRFQKRIKAAEKIISPILRPEHRMNIHNTLANFEI